MNPPVLNLAEEQERVARGFCTCRPCGRVHRLDQSIVLVAKNVVTYAVGPCCVMSNEVVSEPTPEGLRIRHRAKSLIIPASSIPSSVLLQGGRP